MSPLQLTFDQHAALAQAPQGGVVPVVDTSTNREYFLVPAQVYHELCRSRDDFDSQALMDEIARREGWDDPEMDVYDGLDPRSIPV
jgi:hypothetical protein